MLKHWFPSVGNTWLFYETLWMATPWWLSDSLPTKQRGLLRLLKVSHSQNLDLIPLVENLAEENRGRYRKILKKLTSKLKAGTPVLAALEQVPDAISEQDLLALRIGASTGSIDAMYSELIQAGSIQNSPTLKPRLSLAFYSNSLAIIYLLIMSFFVTFIVPVMRQMQTEFGTSKNGISYPLLQFLDNWVGALYPLGLLIFLLFGILRWSIRCRRFFRRVFRRFSGSIPTRIQCQILCILSVVLKAGRPAEAAIPAFASGHFDTRTRLSLQGIESDLNENQNIWSSLTKRNILTAAESKTLQSLDDPASLSWCLREFANLRTERIQVRKHLKSHLMHPLTTLFFAFFVLIIATAMISFLTELVHTLANVV
ncbi:MAG: type II secretion system F family protein [Rubripirellula sp.]